MHSPKPKYSIPKVLVGIPCFNEEEHLADTLKDLKEVLPYNSAKIRIIVFDDGSDDDSVSISLASGISVHRSYGNRGLGENFRNIVAHAIDGGYDLLLTCDADGQFPPQEVKKVLDKAISSNLDLVLGSRFLNPEWSYSIPVARKRGNRVVRFMVSSISGRKISDATCGLRAYSRKSLMSLHTKEKFSYTIESLTQLLIANVDVEEVPIKVKYFEDRKSVISGSLIKYGAKTLLISARLIVGVALSRFLKLSSLLLVPGIFLVGAFFISSISSGRFSGNLYLGLSGVSIIAFSLGTFFFYLISSKMDILQMKLIQIQSYVSPRDMVCHDCILTD